MQHERVKNLIMFCYFLPYLYTYPILQIYLQQLILFFFHRYFFSCLLYYVNNKYILIFLRFEKKDNKIK